MWKPLIPKQFLMNLLFFIIACKRHILTATAYCFELIKDHIPPEVEITLCELDNALDNAQRLHLDKSHGCDGLTANLYKHYTLYTQSQLSYI